MTIAMAIALVLQPNTPKQTDNNPVLVNVRDFGATGDGQMRVADLSGKKGKYPSGASRDLVGIQEAVLAAKPGETVFIPAGEYVLSAGESDPVIKVDKSISILGEPGSRLEVPIDKNGSSSAFLLLFTSSKPLSNVSIRHINFFRGYASFVGAQGSFIDGVTVEHCTFEDGWFTRDKANIPSYFAPAKVNTDTSGFELSLARVKNVVVKSNTFKRSDKVPGRGLVLWRTLDTTVQDNTFTGAFITAINGSGAVANSSGGFDNDTRVVNTVIRGNRVTRSTKFADLAEDHGMYIWGAKNTTIAENTIKGWSLSDAGGSLKFRNAEEATIEDNTFVGSGLLLYSYSAPQGSSIPMLRDVTVRNNTIDLTGSVAKSSSASVQGRAGISYWRNFGKESDTMERNILIHKNKIVNGSIQILGPANGPAFTVADNVASLVVIRPKGAKTRIGN
ncbi:MAG TPA: right-handed parallel beta-helix repeat-containing protein [Fimbriimonas sp.]|nr:right-handed parallel beta-helix repeat-containing protein [Fimbriimonas sp.]